MKKILSLTIVFIMMLTLLCGCKGGNTVSKELTKINNPSTYDEWLNNAKIESLTNVGNTYRLKGVIERAKAGENITIAYIGGSITEGDHLDTCYAARSYRYFCEKFARDGHDQVQYVNAGISGTPSILGSLRVENDVLSTSPDIVFIEYAVNDGSDPDDMDAFDSLIRECWNSESKPAVILLFARMEEGWTSQGWKKEIGAHYDLPMISYADGITYLFDNNVIQWSDFSGDYTHPHAEGCALVNEFISYFYDEVDRLPVQGEEITELPEPMYAEFYQHAHMFDNKTCEPVSNGTWKAKSSGFHYENGWTKTWDDRNEALVFEFTGRHAYVVYPTSGNDTFGTLVANVYFNDKLVKTVSFDEYKEGGWMCPTVGVLYRSPVSGEYRVEFTAKEDNPKCDLQVLAVAYTD